MGLLAPQQPQISDFPSDFSELLNRTVEVGFELLHHSSSLGSRSGLFPAGIFVIPVGTIPAGSSFLADKAEEVVKAACRCGQMSRHILVWQMPVQHSGPHCAFMAT